MALIQESIPTEKLTIIPRAIGAKPGLATFHADVRPELYGLASSFHSLNGMEGQTRPEQVEIDTIDDFCGRYNLEPDFIKSDVEGFEQQVFEGGKSTISHCKPVIIFEF